MEAVAAGSEQHRWTDRGNLVLLAMAIGAALWALARACLQSITMDEATTYRVFVATVQPEHWTPNANNHLLNSLLMRFTTKVFGLSQLTVRLPALMGACLYVLGCYSICRRISQSPLFRPFFFAALVFNPFIADYFAVARGYSLALGFLVCAIAVFAACDIPGEITHRLAAASALIALSFLSNFAFAFIDAAVWAGLLAWAAMLVWPQPRRTRLAPLAAAVLPAALLAAFTASWTLWNWPQGQLFDGASSLRETFASVQSATLHDPNAEIVNPSVAAILRKLGAYLIPLLLAASLLQASLLLCFRRKLPQDARTRRTVILCGVAAGALIAAVLAHWLAFHLFGLLLPRNRTAIYMASLFTIAAGGLASISAPARTVRAGRLILAGLICMAAVYFAACVRMNYFHEWWLCADMKDVYYTLASYNHRYGIRKVPTRAPFTDCLEFYRRVSGQETFEAFTEHASLPAGKDIYPLYESQDRGFIASQHLRIVYRGAVDNDVVIAVRPDLEDDAGNPAERPTEARYDDTDPRIEYAGKWTTDFQFSDAHHGSITYSGDPSASFKLRFAGTWVKYFYTTAPNRGTADIVVDGKQLRTVDLYSPTVQWKQSTTIHALGPGEHVLEVHAGPHRNPSSSAAYLDVDLITAPLP